MGLLDSVIEAAKQQYQTTKRGFGLLASNPQQFAQEATARYFHTKEEEAQFAQAQAAGGDYMQTPYYQKVMDLSQFQGSIKPTGLLNVPTAKQPQVNPQDESVRIYRGSYDTSPNYTVENNFKGKDVYGGVFGSGNLQTAKGFGGDFVYFTDIPKPEILTNYQLNYNIPHKSVKQALLKAMPNMNKKYFNDIYKIVVEDVGSDLRNVPDDVINQFGKIDFGSANNEVQRLRGQVAKNLGYKAIEMLDETGTSYLVTPGAKFTKMETKKVDVPEARADWVRPAPIPGLVGRKRGMTK